MTLHTEASLTALSAKELVALYNETAAQVGANPVNKFSDKKTAVRRTQNLLALIPVDAPKADVEAQEEVPAPVEPEAPAAAPAEKKVRQMVFRFKPAKEQRAFNKASLRGRAVDALLNGASFAEMQALVEEFDADRKKVPHNVERRAYELVRIVHYYLGYGLKEEGGKIYAYTGE